MKYYISVDLKECNIKKVCDFKLLKSVQIPTTINLETAQIINYD